MNTIINVSNILFKSKVDQTNKQKQHDSSIIDQDSISNQKIIDKENYNVEDTLVKEEIKLQKLRNSSHKPKHSILKIFNTVLYEFLIMFFYIILSPFYFFDTYTTKINSSSSLDKNGKDYDVSIEIVDKEPGNEHQERLFFPKKLIPQSVLTKKKVLILDLDETLIHSTNLSEELNNKFENANSEEMYILDKNGTTISMDTKNATSMKNFNKVDSFQIEVSFKLPKSTNIPPIFANSRNSEQTEVTSIYKVYQRPYLLQFLKTCSIWYDIIIYTASLREYSEPIINQLEQLSGANFINRLYRKDCKMTPSGYVKPLDLIVDMYTPMDLKTTESTGNFNGNDTFNAQRRVKGSKIISKESMIIIDNMPVSFKEDVDNGIQINSWYGDPRDIELLKLLPLLEGLRNVADVRLVLGLRNINSDMLN